MYVQFKMDVLYTIKFGFNRSKILALTLIILRQTTFLGIIAATEFDQFYYTLFEVFAYQGTYNLYFLMCTLLFHFLVFLVPLIASYYPFQGSKIMLKGVSLYIKLFPYAFFIALYNYCLTSALNSQDIIIRIASLANIPFLIGFVLFHQLINQSLKFRQIDFCNRRIVSFTGSLLIPLAIIALRVAGPFYSIIFCLIRAAYELFSLYGHCEYVLPQKLRVFFALFTFYFSFLIVLQNFKLVNISVLQNSQNTILVLIAGAITSWILAGSVVTSIWRQMLSKAKVSRQKGEGARSQIEQFPLVRIENQIKILVHSFIQRQKHLQGKKNNYEHFWQQFRQIVFLHTLKCDQTSCVCKKKVDSEEKETLIYLREMLKILTEGSELFGKETRLKVLNIYLFIEIAKKPFKGYYELMILKKQKLPTTIRLEVQNLVEISRECFDQIFFKNKVMNQQLDLLKVISAQESISNLEQLIKEAINAHINFLDIFTYSNVKMSQVETEAQKLRQLKAQIDKILSVLAVEYSDNPSVSLAMFVFYKFLQVYRSKEVELKKLSSQHALKKRLLIRAEGDSFSSQKGIIYLDLIEQRGKILKMTRNIPALFGYSREEMLGFNINLFMPTLFGKYHGKFLSNFVDKGRIKLLKSKNRMIFGKNKKKFIFPIYAQLKTEHLLDNQFGASGLLTPVETNSEFLIIGKNGKIQEITQGLYRKIFAKTLKDQVWKISRICAYKILPALNQILQNWQQGQPSKIYQGVIVFTDEQNYLHQKFRYARDATYTSLSYKTKTSSLSIISTNSISSAKVTSRSQRYEYFTELFKSFLIDIDPKRMKAFKVSFKYSKLKTSEFQVQQIEILSAREEMQGKDYLREVMNEFTNIAEIFELSDQHSPIANHLMELEQLIEKQPQVKVKSGTMTLKLTHIANESHHHDHTEKEISYRSASGSEDELVESNQKKANPQASDQNSMLGTTDSQSKRLILINAFNTAERALPSSAITCAFLASIILFALLIAMTVVYFSSIQDAQQLWKQSSYLLSLTSLFEYRLGTAEILRFKDNANLNLSSQIQTQQDQLNQLMVRYNEYINLNTSNTDISGGIFTFYMPIVDPSKNLTYAATFPQAVAQLSHYFLLQNPADKDILRYNYESLHQNFTAFYQQRFDFYSQQTGQFNSIMVGLLSVYTVLIFLIALSSIPIFLYFKSEEQSVRGKLAFMNVKQIKKAMNKLRVLYDAFKGFIMKGAITRIQNQLHDSKNEKEDDLGGNKVIKLTSQSQGYKQLLCKPQIYCLLFLFVVFFSNLSLTLQILLSGNNAFFLQALDANRLQNQLSNKAPLLLNVYLSNLNRILQNTTSFPYSASTIAQTQNDYFKLLTSLSLPNYTSNSIAMTINQSVTKGICQSLNCSVAVNYNLQDLTQIYKKRFNYWNPNNKITPNNSTITQWISNNNIPSILEQFPSILSLNQYIQSTIDSAFRNETHKWRKIGMWLAVILMPLNALILLIILRKYLNHVNQMVHSAEQLFMHFPAQVLIQNTYLTSYFNAKSKSGK